MMNYDWLTIAHFVCAVAALNWGLHIFLKFNIVSFVSGLIPIKGLDKVLYGLVALCGAYCIFMMLSR